MRNRKICYGVSLVIGVSASACWAGTLGDAHGIKPGFIVGAEGGVANVDWPGMLPLAVNNTFSGTYVTLSDQFNVHSYIGTGGGFVGYKFPISPNVAFIPKVAYHFISNSWVHSTVNYQVTNTGYEFPLTVFGVAQAEFNIVDLTIQANYRLFNGFNFFVEPGVAIVIDKYSTAFNSDPVNAPNGQGPVIINLIENNYSQTITSFRPEISIGLGKMLTDHVNLFAKYTYIKGNDFNAFTPSISPNISMINAGLSFES